MLGGGWRRGQQFNILFVFWAGRGVGTSGLKHGVDHAGDAVVGDLEAGVETVLHGLILVLGVVAITVTVYAFVKILVKTLFFCGEFEDVAAFVESDSLTSVMSLFS